MRRPRVRVAFPALSRLAFVLGAVSGCLHLTSMTDGSAIGAVTNADLVLGANVDCARAYYLLCVEE